MERRSSVERGAAKSSRCMVEQRDAAVLSGWLCDRMESRVRGLMFRVGTLAVICVLQFTRAAVGMLDRIIFFLNEKKINEFL